MNIYKIGCVTLQSVNIDEIISEETDVINLNDNFLPKGLTPLEYLFDSNDVPRKPKMQHLRSNIQECNIGIDKNPKLIKISKSLPPTKKVKYIELLKEFQDGFSWSNEDLKFYDTNIIQHTIPVKENQKPFKRKLRRVNHVLLPTMEKEIQRIYDTKIIAPI